MQARREGCRYLVHRVPELPRVLVKGPFRLLGHIARFGEDLSRASVSKYPSQDSTDFQDGVTLHIFDAFEIKEKHVRIVDLELDRAAAAYMEAL
jgi:hypothetical protein